MCGLAGYNICLDEAHKLDNETAKHIGAEGWEYNLHRGIDAHGFVVTYSPELPYPEPKEEFKESTLYYYKAPGLATSSIEKGILPKGKPVTMGLHTRAGTLGLPAVLENNHPVIWNGVYVTHNGMIDNHINIKRAFEPKDKIPVVDSVAIPMLLSLVKDPFDEVALKEAVSELGRVASQQSAYAFHANWAKHPGLSLFVLGKDRPLECAYNSERKIFVYASEVDALAKIMERFDLDPEDENTTIGGLTEGKAFLMLEGEPLWQHTFKVSQYTNHNTVAPTLKRVDPKGERLGDNAVSSHYTKNTAPYSSLSIATKDKKRLFDLSDLDKWPKFLQETKVVHVGTMLNYLGPNFDRVLFYYPPGDKVTATTNGIAYYAWKGNTEFIFNDLATLRDIINWDDYDKKKNPPWVPIKPFKTKVGDDEVFESWLYFSTSHTQIPTIPTLKIPKEDKKKFAPLTRTVKTPQFTGASGGPRTTSGGDVTKTSGLKEIFPRLLYSEEARKNLIRSVVNPSFVFGKESRCTIHGGTFYSVHEDPHLCEQVMLAARMLLCSVDCLDDLEAIYQEVLIADAGEPCHAGKCGWYVDEDIFLAFNEHIGATYPVTEKCWVAGCNRERHLYIGPNIGKSDYDPSIDEATQLALSKGE